MQATADRPTALPAAEIIRRVKLFPPSDLGPRVDYVYTKLTREGLAFITGEHVWNRLAIVIREEKLNGSLPCFACDQPTDIAPGDPLYGLVRTCRGCADIVCNA